MRRESPLVIPAPGMLTHRMLAFAMLASGMLAPGILLPGTSPLEAQAIGVEDRVWNEQVLRPTGQPVVPIFEGWYPNPDGTHSLCFGFFNLNTREALDIPLGPDNRIEPARYDGMQPTHFTPVPEAGYRRGLCTFAVRVGEDFGPDDRVVWTIRSRGETLSVPGYLLRGYGLDEPESDGRGDVAPVLRIEPDGAQGQGRNGVVAGPTAVRVGEPLELAVRVRHPDRRSWLGWAKHQGPGDVIFGEADVQAEWEEAVEEGRAVTTATFAAPGDYVLRVQAIDAVSSFEFHCCWTNAYVRVSVTE